MNSRSDEDTHKLADTSPFLLYFCCTSYCLYYGQCTVAFVASKTPFEGLGSSRARAAKGDMKHL